MRLSRAFLYLSFALFARVVCATPILVTDSNGQLTSALGVNVDGHLFNVDFVDGSCVDLFGGCDQYTDFVFNPANPDYTVSAQSAAQALLDQVLVGAFSNPANISGCGSNTSTFCDIFTPYYNSPNGRVAATDTRNYQDPALQDRYVGDAGLPPNEDLTDAPTSTFAVWSYTQPGDVWELPIVVPGTPDFHFVLEAGSGRTVFIDPEVSVGYDYEITDSASPLFSSVTAPTGYGDDLYDLLLWDGSSFVFDSILQGGVEHSFADGGVDRFRILGIEQSAAVDPMDPLGFVTGVSFVSGGTVNMVQAPIVVDTDSSPTSVPEPPTLALVLVGILGLGLSRHGRKSNTALDRVARRAVTGA